jgi:predicted O-linked N-acetylglucosamine transferase (SPINDLY family)
MVGQSLAGGRQNAVFQRALAALQSGRVIEAEASLKQVLHSDRRHVAALNLLAVVLVQLGRFAEAETYFRQVLEEQPKSDATLYNYGIALKALNRPAEALERFSQAAALNATVAETWNNRGTVFNELKGYDEAIADFERAIGLNPRYAEAFCNRANSYAALRQFDNVLSDCQRALELKPSLTEAWCGCGNAYWHLKRYDEAFAAFERALGLKANFAEAWLGRGNVLIELKRYKEAFAAYDKALGIKPHLDYAAAARIQAKLRLCDWTNLEAEAAELVSISKEGVVSAPFSLLAIPSSPSGLLQCTRRYAEDLPHFPPLWRGEIYSHDRIRIAYLSADFREHPVAYLTVGLFERHDRSQFDVTGISLGSNHSPIRERLEAAFERFIDAGDKTDQDIAELVRRSEIDIAVDLTGHTQHSRFGVFARRSAPIQVNYLGYLGTLGAKFIDYVIADKIALPFDQQSHFDERIIHLPDCFLATDDCLEIASWDPSRQEAGLPANGFVFSCFNASYKLTRPVFEVWMRVLRAVPDSVLWLVQSNDQMSANLRSEAERLRVDPARLVFASHLPLPQHLARQHLAGLFLDTVPYNAGATGVAALWSGVPVLTVCGETFVGRMAASMLHGIGLPELVAHNLDDYEALAVKLAREPVLLAGLRRRLEENKRRMPLFDTDRFRRHLEQAYRTMVKIQRSGGSPRSFSVEPSVAI